ncbi:DNA repair protein RadC [Ammonifex degensii KC4]|uniref:DNA repair protein RadC n=1 Tax=Ammonifex degensii (strain DSM 10501 / KC4) TaxID=429009 RepID=C9R8K7_AMMDK|nr:DNA repair protein RadC [Ammonifex degensii]ACX52636.1 DNA repair protein RadC [Ammonifex degensii KC4]
MKEEKTYRVSIKELPPSTRPRERLWREGASALSEVELLAIILRTGSARGSALDLARFLLANFGGLKGLATTAVQELSSVPGMGEAKAAQVAAALELGRRLGTLEVSSRPVINSPAAAAQLVVPTMAHLEQEEFRVILLDTKNQLLGIETVAVGGLNSAGVLPREVFRAAVRRSACALILVHNHPSGDPTPSGEDLALTRRLVQAGDLLGIEVLDHLIIGDNCYVSLKEANLW